ncbi:MAG TPA: DUF2461 family protein [Candidatus Dormibacteraeota bacterium]
MHAVTASPRRFAGFSREGLELLRQLEDNNNRAWYTPRRQLFQELLVEPALDLVVELGPLLRERISPGLRAEPRVGGSVLRMQHDARYRKERPFRTHLELWFWEGRGPSHRHPGFFVRVTPDQLVLGAGITLFPPDLLVRYRELVDQPSTGRELVGILNRLATAGLRVGGSCLQRTPRPFPADHERATLLRRLGLRAERLESLPETMPEAVLGPVLPELLAAGLARLRPLHRWLRRLE